MRGYMDFYLKAPIWDEKKTPHTNKKAVPVKTKKVSEVTVLEVKDAFYRESTFDGTFIVVNGSDIKVTEAGKGTKKVFCLWFGHRIPTDYPELKFDLKNARVISNYSGEVVIDLADPSKKKSG